MFETLSALSSYLFPSDAVSGEEDLEKWTLGSSLSSYVSSQLFPPADTGELSLEELKQLGKNNKEELKSFKEETKVQMKLFKEENKAQMELMKSETRMELKRFKSELAALKKNNK